MKDFIEGLRQLLEDNPEIDIVADDHNGRISFVGDNIRLTTNGYNLTQWDFKRFERELGGES